MVFCQKWMAYRQSITNMRALWSVGTMALNFGQRVRVAHLIAASVAVSTIICFPGLALAQSGAAAPADIPAAPLTDAIKQVAERYGVSVGAGGALPAIVTRPVAKPRNVADALKRMLAGTGWVAHRIGPGSWRIEATVRSVVRPVAPPVRLAAPVVPAAIG